MPADKRAPSAALAKARAEQKKRKVAAKAEQAKIEAKHRESGGYGKAVVSIYDEPAGGIKNSPAYLKVLARCGGGAKMPPAKDRAGAPVKGGFPLDKYPVNVIVDGQRVAWLPDDWAQVVKNTGPGGVYHGWMSPAGKFVYHRAGYTGSLEELVGRPVTALDGINGIIRSLDAAGVSVKTDKAFLQKCLTAAERQHVLPAEKFHFGVVSARRATQDRGIHDVMIVDAHFRIAGIRATWYVDAESLEDYRKLGLDAVAGGKLTPARNMVLDVAAKRGQVAVEVSDDIGKWVYYDIGKQDLRGQKDFTKANQALAGTTKHLLTPLAAAQWMLAKMRAAPGKPKLGGTFPTGNATMTMGMEEFSTEHFILGDFFVADTSPCRFDESITLKEDYDYTCSHLKEHGSVLRCNRLILSVRHYSNEGGAVDTRDAKGERERKNIAILNAKWPGVFKENVKRPGEVLLNWKREGCTESKCASSSRREGGSKKSTTILKKGRQALGKKGPAAVKKAVIKAAIKAAKKPAVPTGFPPNSVLVWMKKEANQSYISERHKTMGGKTVSAALSGTYSDASGKDVRYRMADLRYDLLRGYLTMKGAKN